MKYLSYISTLYLIVLMTLVTGCQKCHRSQISPSQEYHNEILIQHKGGIPNIGNTCYMNATLQIVTRLYPDLFNHQCDDLAHHGQTIADKIMHKEYVTAEDARSFHQALLTSYNAYNKEGLRPYEQEDAAPVLEFLLAKGDMQKLELYPTTVHPDNVYTPRTANTAHHELVLPVSFPRATQTSADNLQAEAQTSSSGNTVSMDALVASNLHGNTVPDFIWDSENGIRGDAHAGNMLSMQNLHELPNRILPICIRRFALIEHEPSSIFEEKKITIPIINPFTLTIPLDCLIEHQAEPYTGHLAGFIHHAGSLDSGHYTAYVKDPSGNWMRYNDGVVQKLAEEPLKQAQAAYLYCYQAN